MCPILLRIWKGLSREVPTVRAVPIPQAVIILRAAQTAENERILSLKTLTNPGKPYIYIFRRFTGKITKCTKMKTRIGGVRYEQNRINGSYG